MSGTEPSGRRPPASGLRLPWEQVPPAVRAEVERRLGDRIVEAVTQNEGFSPAAAVRVRLGNSGRAFVKAVGPEPNADATRFYRAEARIAARLPSSAPAPRLIDTFELVGWVVLIFEDISGRHPELPWRRGELDRVLDAVAEMAAAFTPSPIEAPRIVDRHADNFRGWRRLRDTDEDRLDGWTRSHVGALADLETHWADAAQGETLLHGDLRADNILLADDRVYFVDWPHACVGAAWLDVLFMLPSVRMQGGPPPQALIADPDPAITAALAAVAGFFVEQSLRPDPPGLPTLRAFQQAQGAVTLDWLRHRFGDA